TSVFAVPRSTAMSRPPKPPRLSRKPIPGESSYLKPEIGPKTAESCCQAAGHVRRPLRLRTNSTELGARAHSLRTLETDAPTTSATTSSDRGWDLSRHHARQSTARDLYRRTFKGALPDVARGRCRAHALAAARVLLDDQSLPLARRNARGEYRSWDGAVERDLRALV